MSLEKRKPPAGDGGLPKNDTRWTQVKSPKQYSRCARPGKAPRRHAPNQAGPIDEFVREARAAGREPGVLELIRLAWALEWQRTPDERTRDIMRALALGWPR